MYLQRAWTLLVALPLVVGLFVLSIGCEQRAPPGGRPPGQPDGKTPAASAKSPWADDLGTQWPGVQLKGNDEWMADLRSDDPTRRLNAAKYLRDSSEYAEVVVSAFTGLLRENDVNLRKQGYTEGIIKKSLMYCSILKLNIEG